VFSENPGDFLELSFSENQRFSGTTKVFSENLRFPGATTVLRKPEVSGTARVLRKPEVFLEQAVFGENQGFS
jgi:hypothetical protein